MNEGSENLFKNDKRKVNKGFLLKFFTFTGFNGL